MSNHVLARLHHGMLQRTDYVDPHTQATVEIFFHHPSHAEKSAACGLVGLEFDEEGRLQASDSAPVKGRAGVMALLPGMYSKLASLCIDAVHGIEGWPEEDTEEIIHGLPQLTDEARQKLYAPVLVALGDHLFKQSEGTEEEKKH